MFDLQREQAKLYGYAEPGTAAEILKEVLGYPEIGRDYEVKEQLEKASKQIASGNRKEAARTLKILVMTEGMNALAGNQDAHGQTMAAIEMLDFDLEKAQKQLWGMQ